MTALLFPGVLTRSFFAGGDEDEGVSTLVAFDRITDSDYYR